MRLNYSSAILRPKSYVYTLFDRISKLDFVLRKQCETEGSPVYMQCFYSSIVCKVCCNALIDDLHLHSITWKSTGLAFGRKKGDNLKEWLTIR